MHSQIAPYSAHHFRHQQSLLEPNLPISTHRSTQILNQTIASGNTTYGLFDSENTTYFLEIFSTHESQPLFTKHHAAQALSTAPSGTKAVDSNTIYRIGSLTKLFTAYTFLIQAGDVKFNDPVTKYIPELLAASEALNATLDPLNHVSWQDITIGELASHMADIGRDYAVFKELAGPLAGVTDPSSLGVPPLNSSEIPICAGGSFCTRAQFFEGFTSRHPVYAPGTAAIYSNAGYQILSYVLENITAVDFPTLVQESLFKPLSLTGSTWQHPPASNESVIITDELVWRLDFGDETPAGGMYSTLTDFTTLARSIFTSSLLPPAVTRRWMKPRSFTSDPSASVGAPWEIRRYTLPNASRLVDLYTKTGDIPGYASFLVLIPDFDIGSVLLAAGDNPSSNIALISSQIADTVFPAIEAASREEADVAFSGCYTSSDPTLSSNLTLTTSPTLLGSKISSCYSNGTNMLTPLSLSPVAGPSAILYPTGLTLSLPNGETEIGFRAVFEDPNTPHIGGIFSTGCQTWANIDSTYWGSVASDEFVITVGKDGKARSVVPRILRVVLDRVGN